MKSMNLKNRFRLVFFCMIILLVSLAAIETSGILNTKKHVQQAIDEDQLIVSLYELQILSGEYVTNPSERVKKQWQAKYEQIRDRLAEQHSIPEDVNDAYKGMEQLFAGLSSQNDVARNDDASQKVIRSQAVTNLNLESQRIIDWASDISRQTKDGIVQKLMYAGGITLTVIIVVVFAALSIMSGTTRHILESINHLKQGAEEIAGGRLGYQVEDAGNDEIALLAHSVNQMSLRLLESNETLEDRIAQAVGELRRRDWLKSGLSELNTILRGDKSTAELTAKALTFLVEYLGAGVGAFYVVDERESNLKLSASYAFTGQKRLNNRIELGEGLAGQAALERKMICLNSAPPEYLQIGSALGKAEPVNILALPLLHNDVLTGIMEFASFKSFRDYDIEFLNRSTEGIAIALDVNMSRQLVDNLLEATQSQAEELRVQQEELQQTNEELEERAQMLEQQREQIRAKNREVEEASREIQNKAEELERVSAYKSEFLANMSHELRTPLNSLMILSSLLKDNRDGNLTTKQVEFASTINGAGRDLLNLINDILDLSKIESGHMEYHYEELPLPEIYEQLQIIFNPIAEDKGIGFTVTLDQSAPQAIIADSQRTLQILKNLVSNACKFTSEGSVAIHIYTPDGTENPLKTETVAFSVTDTGIGIPIDKQTMIFNAFQQADGSTSRTYGGTGLGLSISRQLARSMRGEISLTTVPGKGSTFTLYLPVSQAVQRGLAGSPGSPGSNGEAKPIVPRAPITPVIQQLQPTATPINFDLIPAPIPDDREKIQEGVGSILVIEDDLTFAGVLADMVRARGFSLLVAADGESGILLADRYQPSAVILDVMLPHIDGWGVMRSLKDNPRTRHIPVHFITCLEERQKAMNMGAIGFITKPVSGEQLDAVFTTLESTIAKSTKKLLIVEDDPAQVQAMVALLEEKEVAITVAESGAKARAFLSAELFDCIVLDLGLADISAFDLLEELKRLYPERRIPVIIHTGRELTREDETRLHHYAESIIIKGAKSPERLLNEVTLFLHLVETSLDPDKQHMIRSALDKESLLEGKKVLIVDDDMRNIFSLSSALEQKDVIILEAENGREALRMLDEHPDVDLVLMDIMMPEMDGYETMRHIRKDSRFQDLPIIALTAKAMKGDREECFKAGASDYISKPVDVEKLFSLLRVWLYPAAAAGSVELG